MFTIPDIVIKVLLGEMREALLLSGKKVVPNKAIDASYEFKDKSLETALKDVLK